MTFKTAMTVLALLCSLAPCPAMDRMSALSMLESGDNDRAVGRAGEVSRFQIGKSAWRTVDLSVDYTNSNTARVVAETILRERIGRFQRKFGRLPDDFEFYVLWNAPAQVLSQKLPSISDTVLERAQRFENLCKRNQ